MSKIKIIALIGEAGSGKDYLLHRAMAHYPDYHEIISTTTRPPREGEVEGKNYYFVDYDTFYELMDNGDMLECTNFNNWWYGTSLNSLDKDKVNIGVFNPAGIMSLSKNKNIDLRVFYVRAPARERLIRQLEREQNADVREIIRRYEADETDFANLNFIYEDIKNSSIDNLWTALEQLRWTKTDKAQP
jgi:guanylate kinase